MYRRAATSSDGTVHLETDVLDLDPDVGEWNAYPSLTVLGRTVHFVWQGGGHARYRSLTHDAGGWRWSTPVDTGIPSTGRDIGPAIAATASTIHIVTPGGIYGWSTDGGFTWSAKALPLPEGGRVKTASIAVDPKGRPVIAASVVLHGPGSLSQDHGSGAYWSLLLLRRQPDGAWQALNTPLTGREEWDAPANVREDVLADWVRLAIDQSGAMHLTWHGTAVSRVYGNDRAYYASLESGSGWTAPIPLRDPITLLGLGSSYAPSLSLDGTVGLPLVFYEMNAAAGAPGFDADLLIVQHGKAVGPRLPVARFMRRAILTGEPSSALGARFPAAAPTTYHTPNGRIWLDVLDTFVPTDVPDAAKLIVYQRLDLTGRLPHQ
jgi:hypothetical protein